MGSASAPGGTGALPDEKPPQQPIPNPRGGTPLPPQPGMPQGPPPLPVKAGGNPAVNSDYTNIVPPSPLASNHAPTFVPTRASLAHYSTVENAKATGSPSSSSTPISTSNPDPTMSRLTHNLPATLDPTQDVFINYNSNSQKSFQDFANSLTPAEKQKLNDVFSYAYANPATGLQSFKPNVYNQMGNPTTTLGLNTAYEGINPQLAALMKASGFIPPAYITPKFSDTGPINNLADLVQANNVIVDNKGNIITGNATDLASVYSRLINVTPSTLPNYKANDIITSLPATSQDVLVGEINALGSSLPQMVQQANQILANYTGAVSTVAQSGGGSYIKNPGQAFAAAQALQNSVYAALVIRQKEIDVMQGTNPNNAPQEVADMLSGTTSIPIDQQISSIVSQLNALGVKDQTVAGGQAFFQQTNKQMNSLYLNMTQAQQNVLNQRTSETVGFASGQQFISLAKAGQEAITLTAQLADLQAKQAALNSTTYQPIDFSNIPPQLSVAAATSNIIAGLSNRIAIPSPPPQNTPDVSSALLTANTQATLQQSKAMTALGSSRANALVAGAVFSGTATQPQIQTFNDIISSTTKTLVIPPQVPSISPVPTPTGKGIDQVLLSSVQKQFANNTANTFLTQYKPTNPTQQVNTTNPTQIIEQSISSQNQADAIASTIANAKATGANSVHLVNQNGTILDTIPTKDLVAVLPAALGTYTNHTITLVPDYTQKLQNFTNSLITSAEKAGATAIIVSEKTNVSSGTSVTSQYSLLTSVPISQASTLLPQIVKENENNPNIVFSFTPAPVTAKETTANPNAVLPLELQTISQQNQGLGYFNAIGFIEKTVLTEAAQLGLAKPVSALITGLGGTTFNTTPFGPKPIVTKSDQINLGFGIGLPLPITAVQEAGANLLNFVGSSIKQLPSSIVGGGTVIYNLITTGNTGGTPKNFNLNTLTESIISPTQFLPSNAQANEQSVSTSIHSTAEALGISGLIPARITNPVTIGGALGDIAAVGISLAGLKEVVPIRYGGEEGTIAFPATKEIPFPAGGTIEVQAPFTIKGLVLGYGGKNTVMLLGKTSEGNYVSLSTLNPKDIGLEKFTPSGERGFELSQLNKLTYSKVATPQGTEALVSFGKITPEQSVDLLNPAKQIATDLLKTPDVPISKQELQSAVSQMNLTGNEEVNQQLISTLSTETNKTISPGAPFKGSIVNVVEINKFNELIQERAISNAISKGLSKGLSGDEIILSMVEAKQASDIIPTRSYGSIGDLDRDLNVAKIRTDPFKEMEKQGYSLLDIAKAKERATKKPEYKNELAQSLAENKQAQKTLNLINRNVVPEKGKGFVLSGLNIEYGNVETKYVTPFEKTVSETGKNISEVIPPKEETVLTGEGIKVINQLGERDIVQNELSAYNKGKVFGKELPHKTTSLGGLKTVTISYQAVAKLKSVLSFQTKETLGNYKEMATPEIYEKTMERFQGKETIFRPPFIRDKDVVDLFGLVKYSARTATGARKERLELFATNIKKHFTDIDWSIAEKETENTIYKVEKEPTEIESTSTSKTISNEASNSLKRNAIQSGRTSISSKATSSKMATKPITSLSSKSINKATSKASFYKSITGSSTSIKTSLSPYSSKAIESPASEKSISSPLTNKSLSSKTSSSLSPKSSSMKSFTSITSPKSPTSPTSPTSPSSPIRPSPSSPASGSSTSLTFRKEEQSILIPKKPTKKRPIIPGLANKTTQGITPLVAKKADFIGNVSDINITGIYNRKEITYGSKEVAHLSAKDVSRFGKGNGPFIKTKTSSFEKSGPVEITKNRKGFTKASNPKKIRL